VPLAAGVAAAAPAAAAPSCGDGPELVGSTIVGTPCADTIRLPRSVTTVLGEGGDDVLFGQRGNDSLFGGEGDDRLYGGVGDDRLRGGPGADLLSGGFGADSLDGEEGDDLVRGDATVDALGDSGGGSDTISFATGATPGFPNAGSFFSDAGFPPEALGRGVYVDLGAAFANNGLAPSGGGVDEPLGPATDLSDFETVVGTAFSDYLVGTADAEAFHGGGGSDLIHGGGGADIAHGGADGDGCDTPTAFECESTEDQIALRDPGAVSVGLMAPQSDSPAALYVTGSDGADVVTVGYGAGVVTFSLGPGSTGGFDAAPSAAGGCGAPVGGQVECPVSEPPDSIVMAGLAGDDQLTATGLPETTSIVLLGGEEDDELAGGETEDALVDGAGNDVVAAGGRDDAVPNNGGADLLDAGPGEDLFVSNAVCDGDTLDGGPDRDNANWANFDPGGDTGVAVDMGLQVAGLVGAGGEPACPGPLTALEEIEDIEGSKKGDNLVGDAGPNQILGRLGPDNYLAGPGNDHLLANSGDADPLLDCGQGFDTALVDHPQLGDAAPTGCESVEARNPNSFRPPDTPPGPEPQPEPLTSPPPPPPPPDPPRLDRRPPQTRITAGPRRLLRIYGKRRRIVLRFTANERRVTFRCKLDRRPAFRCRSPQAFTLRPGRHMVRILAIDAAGNRDPSPAVKRLRVRRR
jgi:Ca2+-binding RTX toxin-like protein